MRRHFSAPVEKLYRAWCDPLQIGKWFGPGAMTVPEASVDLRVGGRYRVVMVKADQSRHVVGGEYLQISENALLRFSWRWEGSPVATEVELRFAAHGEGSELQLIHRQFGETDARDKHIQGWNGSLDNLAKFIEAREGAAA
jgi:uncharacterized protein YndB with AHSA1/START domain